jgi:hypothetical protein
MPRTRDLLIYVAILFVLCAGIAYALISGAEKNGGASEADLAMISGPDAYTAVNTKTEVDRQSIIDRLRSAIAQNDSGITPEPSVETPVSEPETPEEENGTGTPGASLMRCSTADNDAQKLQAYPLTGVSVALEGAARVVLSQPDTAEASASSSASTTKPTPSPVKLLTIPVSPSPLIAAQCVPSDAIGITPYGAVLYNSDVNLYRSYGAEALIGYARDGYPIYGSYGGEVDSCGGYESGNGYRYTVSPDRSFIVGCFRAIPAPFTNL